MDQLDPLDTKLSLELINRKLWGSSLSSCLVLWLMATKIRGSKPRRSLYGATFGSVAGSTGGLLQPSPPSNHLIRRPSPAKLKARPIGIRISATGRPLSSCHSLRREGYRSIPTHGIAMSRNARHHIEQGSTTISQEMTGKMCEPPSFETPFFWASKTSEPPSIAQCRR